MGVDHSLQLAALQERISAITNQVESEVLTLRSNSYSSKSSLGTDCNQLVEQLCAVYKQGFDQIEAHYKQNLDEVLKEIKYLKELSESQQIMMKSKVDYIKELEERHTRPEGLT